MTTAVKWQRWIKGRVFSGSTVIILGIVLLSYGMLSRMLLLNTDTTRKLGLLNELQSSLSQQMELLDKEKLKRIAELERIEEIQTSTNERLEMLRKAKTMQEQRIASLNSRIQAGIGRRGVASDPNLPYIYLITPTHARITQKVDLVRMCHTLLLVPNIYWIIIEDAEEKTQLVSKFLSQCGVEKYLHISARTPPEHRLEICKVEDRTKGCPHGSIGKLEQSWRKPRGVAQRNAGINAMLNLNPTSGVFYFADDDNTYSLELFEVIRNVQRVSVWNVGLSGGLIHEGPVVKENGEVVSWHVGWRPERPFPIDMAAFAVSIDAVKNVEKLEFSATAPRGFLESMFLLQVLSGKEEITAVFPACQCVLVWHTRTEKPLLNREFATPSDKSIEV